jgi:hypothetical protein
MDSNKRRVGRPKAPPQTGPLVLGGEDRKRTKVTLEIAAGAAVELAEYARWVEQSSGVAAAEATSTTVTFALRETFRRDRLWQERRRPLARPEDADAIPKAQAPSPPPLLPPASPGRPAAGLALPLEATASAPGTRRSQDG